MSDNLKSTRREMLKVASLAAAGISCGAFAAGGTPAAAGELAASSRRRTLRLAHLTDIHVQPERQAPGGMIACLHHVQSQPDPVELILTGGDSIMDSFGADASRTRAQWDIWQKVLRDECSLKVEPCIGNHDVWGWKRESSRTTGEEPLYGKRWAMDALGLSKPYCSFEKAGWHFIVLDSVHGGPGPGSYIARLDDQQFEWLRTDLEQLAGKRPVCVLSHIPILSAASFFDGDNEKAGDWVVPAAWMHVDARRIKDLFAQHPNVRLCLSGHLHLADRVDYNGVTYLCNGAVCGNWWKGAYQECQEGYGLIDLFDDGTFDHQYVTYGWRVQG